MPRGKPRLEGRRPRSEFAAHAGAQQGDAAGVDALLLQRIIDDWRNDFLPIWPERQIPPVKGTGLTGAIEVQNIVALLHSRSGYRPVHFFRRTIETGVHDTLTAVAGLIGPRGGNSPAARSLS